ncbi:DNA helicase [Tanacetum coccineum]
MNGIRGYELPTADLLEGIVFEDGPRSKTDFDVIIEFRGGPPQKINKLHQSYMSLQFPLLFIPVASACKGVWAHLQEWQAFLIVRGHGLYDAVSRGDREGIAAGSKIILPRTFTGGPRYWPEIKRYMAQYPELTPADRADVICRVFEQKVDSKNEMQDAQQIDNYIFAKIPDSVQDPKGYKLVTELMMHGPYVPASPSAACMQEGSCSKHFSKTYNDRTFFDSNGHTYYRKRDTRVHVMKGESKLDNCNVVPYNRALCLAFEAHINVEYCGWSMLLKYLFKYILKGPDCMLAKISNSDKSTMTTGNIPHIDEIQNYVDEFGLQSPPQHLLRDLQNKLLMEEKNYKRDLLREKAAESVPKLNHDQRKIFDLIISISTTNRQELLFVYGHGGTGETFLWRTIISSLRSHGKIVLGVASSSIASLLLRLYFCISTSASRTHSPFPGASKEELIAASIAKSHLWPYFKVCTLKENLWLLRSGLTSEQQRRSEQFSKWLLDMGNGEIGEPDAENEQDSSWVTIPPEYTVTTDEAGMSKLIDFIYDDTTLKATTAGSACRRRRSCVQKMRL